MSESQIKLNEKRKLLRQKLCDTLPNIVKHSAALGEEAYKDGALSAKTKRLQALAIGLGIGCTNCILSQCEQAINQGATKEEILETLGVVMSMRGTTGIGECLRVIDFLEELEE